MAALASRSAISLLSRSTWPRYIEIDMDQSVGRQA
jgi:hypothetical protein